MKTIVYSVIFLAASANTWSTGWLNFDTRIPDVVDAPVYDVDGHTLLSGPEFMGQLYSGVSSETLAAVGTPVAFETGMLAGYIQSTDPPIVHSITTGGAAYVQLRAWRVKDGTTYEAAVANRGHFESSNIIFITVGCSDCVQPVPPEDLVGLKGFTLSAGPLPARLLFSVSSNDTVQLSILAQPSTHWEIQSSLDLASWQKVQTQLVDSSGSVRLLLPYATTQCFFYRAILAQ